MQYSEKEKFARLKLLLSDNVGPITFRDLIKVCHSAEKAIEYIPVITERSKSKRVVKLAPDSLVEQQFELAQKKNVEILFKGEDDFPKSVAQFDNCPPILFSLGNKKLLNTPSLSIVGSRSASANGQTMARRLGASFIEEGFSVVSGMALGIDGAAHQGALAVNSDKVGTVAVLGCGVDVIYPKEHTALYEMIKERGCIISEFVFGLRATHTTFPRRNRIISALSLGTVVVEATQMSGSLITAKEALNQGKEVFAVPGSPLDARSDGPNMLIRQGAHIVTHPQDVFNALGFKEYTGDLSDVTRSVKADPYLESSAYKMLSDSERQDYKLIESKLSPSVTSIDSLLRETGLPASRLNAILVEMELEGKIERFAGNNVALSINIEWNK